MPSGRSLGNALASLSEEPNASGKVLEVSGSSSLLEIQCAALQHSGSSPHSAAEDEVDRLPSDRPCSDKGAEGTASAGSSEYSSSSGSYYNSSNNSSRSSSPVADEDDENGLDDINTDAQQGNNLPEVAYTPLQASHTSTSKWLGLLYIVNMMLMYKVSVAKSPPSIVWVTFSCFSIPSCIQLHQFL